MQYFFILKNNFLYMYTCDTITDNGNLQDSGQRWFTLQGNVQCNGDVPRQQVVYDQNVAWTVGGNVPFNFVHEVTATRHASGDVDIYID